MRHKYTQVYTKYKMSVSIMTVLCIKQHLKLNLKKKKVKQH